MRVIMSPIGSVIAMVRSPSPARLHEAGNQALGAEVPHRDAAHLELAVIGPRPPRHLAAIADARGRSVARQLGELQGGGEPLFQRPRLAALVVLAALPPAGKLLRQPAPPVVLLDRALLRHSGLLDLSASEVAFSPSLPGRAIESSQQAARCLVGALGRADRDVHAPYLCRLVLVDL